MSFADRKGVVRIGTAENGNGIYRRNNKIYTVGIATGQQGYYPCGSRAASYEGGTDRRHTQETIDAVREMRRDGKIGRHVHPGTQP
jgi:hypothetical protein